LYPRACCQSSATLLRHRRGCQCAQSSDAERPKVLADVAGAPRARTQPARPTTPYGDRGVRVRESALNANKFRGPASGWGAPAVRRPCTQSHQTILFSELLHLRSQAGLVACFRGMPIPRKREIQMLPLRGEAQGAIHLDADKRRSHPLPAIRPLVGNDYHWRPVNYRIASTG
jgi:hypothetical protein